MSGLRRYFRVTGVTLSGKRRVYARYSELWRIEEGFRVLKHTLAIRPVFHGTARRVKAPVAI